MKKIKNRLVILSVAFIVFLFSGYKDNGTVTYYGFTYDVGSVFSPERYSSYGLFESAEKELNQLLSEKRGGSLALVVLSGLTMFGALISLWKEDEFKDLLIELRKM